jgi:hypothetical protein
MSASTAPPTITPRIQGSSAALEDGVAVVEIERRAVVVVAAIVDTFVVAVVGGLAAVQLSIRRLAQRRGERVVAQSCGFR